MKKSTVIKLNELNKKFYSDVAQEFSDSRNYYWLGWEKLLPFIRKSISNNNLRVLDLGCGNGRFANFILDHFDQLKLDYIGVDSSKKLLKIAYTKLADKKMKLHLKRIDIVESLLNDTLSGQFQDKKFDLIVILGVMHHVPSAELRKKLIATAKLLLSSRGVLVFTSWQFYKVERLKKKIVEPSLVGLQQEELEKNDYILDWQRGRTAYRYCHHLDDLELDTLLADTNLKLIKTFTADGKEKNVNRYLVSKVGYLTTLSTQAPSP